MNDFKKLSEQEKLLLLDSLADKLNLLKDDIETAKNDMLLIQILMQKIKATPG